MFFYQQFENKVDTKLLIIKERNYKLRILSSNIYKYLIVIPNIAVRLKVPEKTTDKVLGPKPDAWCEFHKSFVLNQVVFNVLKNPNPLKDVEASALLVVVVLV